MPHVTAQLIAITFLLTTSLAKLTPGRHHQLMNQYLTKLRAAECFGDEQDFSCIYEKVATGPQILECKATRCLDRSEWPPYEPGTTQTHRVHLMKSRKVKCRVLEKRENTCAGRIEKLFIWNTEHNNHKLANPDTLTDSDMKRKFTYLCDMRDGIWWLTENRLHKLNVLWREVHEKAQELQARVTKKVELFGYTPAEAYNLRLRLFDHYTRIKSVISAKLFTRPPSEAESLGSALKESYMPWDFVAKYDKAFAQGWLRFLEKILKMEKGSRDEDLFLERLKSKGIPYPRAFKQMVRWEKVLTRYVNMGTNLADAQEHTFQALRDSLQVLEDNFEDLTDFEIDHIRQAMKMEERADL